MRSHLTVALYATCMGAGLTAGEHLLGFQRSV